ncbi:hypothetical protein CHS0354_015287 [Potamilus streckersoni]|uniref:RING-type domain-containing protein n=1 Tax=Potamilus streckersoni TaxID=2493646 RepID=A0AAE0RZY5_9BIVA|nr:hypothetical protein CHS0354_015287 [Potamilus streckersoni]
MMVAWSSMLGFQRNAQEIGQRNDMSNSSSDESVKQTIYWADTLKCYVCKEHYSRPRVLPCGHSFCLDCIVRLRDAAAHNFNVHKEKNAHRRGEGGFFTCPMPDCHYSMKLMNVGRWTPKNKAMGQTVLHYKKQKKAMKEMATQTDITLENMLVTIPKALVNANPSPQHVQNTGTSVSALSQILHNAFSTDSLDRPITEENSSWSYYVARIGLAVLEQII